MKTPPSLELLESRIAPAGLVQVTLTNGVLKLVGDLEANDLTIEATGPGLLALTGNNGTMIQFGAGAAAATATVTGLVTDLSSDLGDGSDVLSLNYLSLAKTVVLKDSLGDNTFNLLASRTAGAFSMTTGPGKDTVSFSGPVFSAKTVALALGDGDNTMSTTVDAGSTTNFKFTGGTGADTINKTAGDWEVNGPLTWNMGPGANNVNLTGGSLQVTGAVNILHGAHASGTSITNLAQFSANFKSTVTVSYVDGTNSTTVNGFDMVLNSLKVNGGTGADTVTMLGTIVAKGITLRLGDGADTLSFGGVRMTVTGLADYGFGEGANAILNTVSVADYNGGLKVTGGSGDDNLVIRAANLNLPRGATIDGGGGANSIGLFGNVLDAGGAVLFKSGAHALGTSTSFIAFNRISAPSVMASYGAGAESFSLNSTSDTFIRAGLTISAPGAGFTQVTLTGASINIAGKLAVTAGTEGVSLTNTGSVLNIGSVQVTEGAGTGTVNLNSAGLIGSMTLKLGAGSSTVTLTGQREGLAIKGALSITTASLLAADTDVLTMSNLSLLGKTTILQGAGVGTVNVENILAAAWSLDTKAGNDTINIETQSTGIVSMFTGAVNILLGAGTNTLTIGNNADLAKANFRSTVKVVGGADPDTFNDNGNLYLTGQPVTTAIP